MIDSRVKLFSERQSPHDVKFRNRKNIKRLRRRQTTTHRLRWARFLEEVRTRRSSQQKHSRKREKFIDPHSGRFFLPLVHFHALHNQRAPTRFYKYFFFAFVFIFIISLTGDERWTAPLKVGQWVTSRTDMWVRVDVLDNHFLRFGLGWRRKSSVRLTITDLTRRLIIPATFLFY